MAMNRIFPFLLVFISCTCLGAQGQIWNGLGPYYPIQYKGRVGLMDGEGKTLLEPTYFSIWGVSDSTGAMAFGLTDEGGLQLANSKLELLPGPKFEKWKPHNPSGLIALRQRDQEYRLYSIRHDSLFPEVYPSIGGSDFPICQIAPRQWKIFLNPDSTIGLDGVDSVEMANTQFCAVRRGEVRSLYFYSTGKEIPFIAVSSSFVTRRGWKMYGNKGWYIVDRESMQVGGPFGGITEVPWGYIVTDGTKKFALVNLEGDTIIPGQMDRIIPWGSLLEVTKESQMALMDTSGKNLTGFKFHSRSPFADPKVAMFHTADSTYFILQDGSVPLVMPLVKYEGHNAMLISFSGKGGMGVVDKQGKVLAPPIYKKLRLLTESSAQVLTDSGPTILHFLPEGEPKRKILVIRAEEEEQEDEFGAGWSGGAFDLQWRITPPWGRNDSLARSRGWFRGGPRNKWGFVDAMTGDTVVPPVMDALFPMPNQPFTVVVRSWSNNILGFGIFNDGKKRIEVQPTCTHFDWNTLQEHGKPGS